ncbi:MAG TPA: ABC transporter ATP-binding protein [Acidimicrobiales bacterium]|jgi:branched-chain amino acid transport system ATP-binding protein
MALEVGRVSVNFGGLRALTDVSLSVDEGSVTGLIGPNGAGKTTLFDVITGMRKPTKGTVTFNGRDLRGVSPYQRSRLGVGRTFQRLELFGTLTVRENVRVAASIGRRSRRRASEHTESVEETTERLLETMHLEQVADTRADTLPTGTGRLVELARALAVRPTALLLDEPASGQNVEETKRFASVLRSLTSEGLAVLLVEHDMDLVMSVSDVVFVLVEGSILCSGTPQDIQRDPAVAEAYLGSVVQADHD